MIGQATKYSRLCLKSRRRSFNDPLPVKLIIKSVGTKRLLREAVEKSRTAATQKGSQPNSPKFKLILSKVCFGFVQE
jgi:hypothetical protein